MTTSTAASIRSWIRSLTGPRRSRRTELMLGAFAVAVLGSWVALLFLAPADTSDAHGASTAGVSLTASTPHLRQAAAALQAHQVYVDPALAGVAPAGVESGALHDALVSSSTPVFLTVMMLDDSADGSGGDDNLTLARLHHLVGRDGVYVLDEGDGTCWVADWIDGRRHTGYCPGVTASDIASMRKDARSDVDGSRAARLLYPVLVGAAAVVVIRWVFLVIAALRRRSRSVAYLGLR